MQQALEAIEGSGHKADLIAAADALRAALAEPAQPVAWVAKHWSVFNTGAEVASGLSLDEAMDYLTDERAARGWCVVCVINKDNMAEPTTPAPQPLTDEDIHLITGHCGVSKHAATSIARAVEAEVLKRMGVQR